jgi:hypothetical protein
MAALVTAALDDRLATPGSHSGAKTMLALAATNIGLISAFHREEVRNRGYAVALGYEPTAAASKRRWLSPYGRQTPVRRDDSSTAKS